MKFIPLLLGILVLAWTACGHAQIVTDGGFEGAGYPLNGNIGNGSSIVVNGWTFSAEGGGANSGHALWLTPGSNGAGHFMEIASNNAGSSKPYAQTTMNGLVAGASYSLVFDLIGPPNVDLNAQGSNDIAVFLNGSSTASAIYTPAAGWVTQAPLVFIATGTSETVRFRENSSSGSVDFGLDEVSVQATTPEPNSLAMGLLVSLGITLVDRRKIRRKVSPCCGG